MKQEYKDFVEKQLKPFLENNIQEGDILSEDQTRIHYYEALRDDAKASILIIHGFTEFFGKHHENAYRFFQAEGQNFLLSVFSF